MRSDAVNFYDHVIWVLDIPQCDQFCGILCQVGVDSVWEQEQLQATQ